MDPRPGLHSEAPPQIKTRKPRVNMEIIKLDKINYFHGESFDSVYVHLT